MAKLCRLTRDATSKHDRRIIRAIQFAKVERIEAGPRNGRLGSSISRNYFSFGAGQQQSRVDLPAWPATDALYPRQSEAATRGQRRKRLFIQISEIGRSFSLLGKFAQAKADFVAEDLRCYPKAPYKIRPPISPFLPAISFPLRSSRFSWYRDSAPPFPSNAPSLRSSYRPLYRSNRRSTIHRPCRWPRSFDSRTGHRRLFFPIIEFVLWSFAGTRIIGPIDLRAGERGRSAPGSNGDKQATGEEQAEARETIFPRSGLTNSFHLAGDATSPYIYIAACWMDTPPDIEDPREKLPMDVSLAPLHSPTPSILPRDSLPSIFLRLPFTRHATSISISPA